jgi:carbonic anhydrase
MPGLTNIINSIGQQSGDGVTLSSFPEIQPIFDAFSGYGNDYYTYGGSLTSWPCYHGAIHILMRQEATISTNMVYENNL